VRWAGDDIGSTDPVTWAVGRQTSAGAARIDRRLIGTEYRRQSAPEVFCRSAKMLFGHSPAIRAVQVKNSPPYDALHRPLLARANPTKVYGKREAVDAPKLLQRSTIR
jgi:hypothetical protein